MRVLLSIMKKLLFALFALASVVLFASDSRSEIAKKLYGRIRVVEGCEDYRVRIVSGCEDLRVRIVSGAANSPGKWEFVDGCEDFRIRFVDGCEDVSIRFVDGCEGPN